MECDTRYDSAALDLALGLVSNIVSHSITYFTNQYQLLGSITLH